MIPLHLLHKLSLQDVSGRVHWLLVTSSPSYAKYVRENISVYEDLVQRFTRETFLYEWFQEEIEYVIRFLPNGSLHGENKIPGGPFHKYSLGKSIQCQGACNYCYHTTNFFRVFYDVQKKVISYVPYDKRGAQRSLDNCQQHRHHLFVIK